MPEIDNLLGSTRRVVEEQEPLNNCRGVTYRVLNVGGGGSGVTSVNGKTGDVVLDASDVGAVTQTVATISLVSTDWSSHTQTKTVTGVTADNTVIVAPAPASAADYATAEILCTAQAANSLTFTCTTDPVNNVSVNVVILN